ncbi:hypothetical protein ASG92_03965 [Arthrobacter sp. Soil736]|uniref:hypothetical protein n=1 Tax=Arthrobacter sp. Soil736 TaxID=1736395 RepID=UPI0007007B3F|nr:hypothetical protein [Arthrobacter sp. Soil736]KRE64063.1 hypothetical protein ASG92_03965 [Arthrobacter sp. Soil736]
MRLQALLTVLLLALGGGLVVVPVAASVAEGEMRAATNCAVRLLAGLGGRGSNAIAASSNGLVVGIADTAMGGSAPVLWRDGRPTPLTIPLQTAVPTSVNRAGVVVGSGYDAIHEVLVGWWWKNGLYHRLPVSPGDIALPSAVSDSGAVAGVLIADEEHSDGPGADEDERPAVWSTVTAAPRELPLPAGARGGHAFAIGPDGTIGGVALADGGTPVLWAPDGTPKVLPALAGRGGVVLAIDSAGQALGQSAVPEGTHAVAWGASGLVTDLGAAAAGPTSSAQGGVAGIAVGAGSTPSFRASRPQAVMWVGKSARILPPGSDGQLAGVSGSASSVSRQGGTTVVVGFSAAANGLRRATEWSCR